MKTSILVNARLALFGVDQQKLSLGGRVACRFPLGTNREVGTTTTAQARVFDELPDGGAAHGKRFLESAIGAGRERVNAAQVSAQARLTWLGPSVVA
jgi:hypothetical protein